MVQQVDWNTFDKNWGKDLRGYWDASNTDYAAQQAAIAQKKADWTAANPSTYDHDGGWSGAANPWDSYTGGQRDGDAMAYDPWTAVKKASGWSGDNGQTGNAFTDLQGNAIAKTGGESGMDYLGLDANGNELYSSAGDNGQGQRSWQQWIHNKGSNTLDAVGAPSLSKYDPAAMGRHALTNLAIVGTAGLAGGALLGGEAAGLGGATTAPVFGGSAVGTDLGLLGGDSLEALLASNGAFGTAEGAGAGLGAAAGTGGDALGDFITANGLDAVDGSVAASGAGSTPGWLSSLASNPGSLLKGVGIAAALAGGAKAAGSTGNSSAATPAAAPLPTYTWDGTKYTKGDGQQFVMRPNTTKQFAHGGDVGIMGGAPQAARAIHGVGDGLSDSIPVRMSDGGTGGLSDGEFVIPADVVSGLGNGSSDAGVRALHEMMSRIRTQAHGSTRQARPVSQHAVLPA